MQTLAQNIKSETTQRMKSIYDRETRLIIVGDLTSEKGERKISYQEMSEFATLNDFDYFEINTKTNFNVMNLIQDIATS